MVQREEIKKHLLFFAEQMDLEPTENFEKIVNAKQRMGVIWACPCDANNKKRGCGSKLCMEEIDKNGTCHCHCWKKK